MVEEKPYSIKKISSYFDELFKQEAEIAKIHIEEIEKKNHFSMLQKAALIAWATGIIIYLQNQEAGFNHYNFLWQFNDQLIQKMQFDSLNENPAISQLRHSF